MNIFTEKNLLRVLVVVLFISTLYFGGQRAWNNAYQSGKAAGFEEGKLQVINEIVNQLVNTQQLRIKIPTPAGTTTNIILVPQ